VEGTFDSIPFENNFFNILLMNHILEHVQNPLKDLQKARKILKPGGYIVGEIPNIKSFDYQLFKRYWGGLHVPRHTFQYSPESFCALVEKSGLEVVSLGYELNTTHWALSVQNYIEGGRIAAGKGSRLNFGRAWYYSVLLLAFIPINVLSKLYQRTGVISFVLRKRAE
jgi:predicted SAM-dependent methyltransferase